MSHGRCGSDDLRLWDEVIHCTEVGYRDIILLKILYFNTEKIAMSLTIKFEDVINCYYLTLPIISVSCYGESSFFVTMFSDFY